LALVDSEASQMLFNRQSGILLHPTSLPGPHGIGELGHEAFRFVELLERAGQSLWQVLPLTPPGQAFSPYYCSSSFAGNALLLPLDELWQRGLLEPFDREVLEAVCSSSSRLDSALVRDRKAPLLRHAAAQFLTQAHGEQRDAFDAFRDQQAYWLRDFARYRAIGRNVSAEPWVPWWSWPSDLRRREPGALLRVDHELESAIRVEEALQFLFEQAWQGVRRHANQRGIRIIGDVPIFVAHDSADVWAAQHLFRLDGEGRPLVVSGVPPDYFSKTGQRWGNPLYAWERHEADGFDWWLRRLARTFQMTDIVRVDHFRGLAACWEIPADEPTAVHGRWVASPGRALLSRVREHFGDVPIVAEDLGIITDDVDALRDEFLLPTMRVLQFSFSGEEKLLPHHYPENCVAYTGTHDNNTVVGWYCGKAEDRVNDAAAVAAERDRVRRYYSTDGTDIQWTCMRALLQSHCSAVLFPFQDVLGLGSEARMNTPGTVGNHNWSWRFRWEQLEEPMVEGLAFLTRQAGRNQR
jgi:4-alpha-glucanotransferase